MLEWQACSGSMLPVLGLFSTVLELPGLSWARRRLGSEERVYPGQGNSRVWTRAETCMQRE